MIACSVSSKKDESSSSAQPAGISGKVTGDSIEGVQITLETPSGTNVRTALTDENGNYILDGLEIGKYVIVPEKEDMTVTPKSVEVDYNLVGIQNIDFVAAYRFPEFVNSFAIPISGTPTDLDAHPSGNFLYVAQGSPDGTAPTHSVRVIDTFRNTIHQTIPLEEHNPIDLVIANNGATFYTANQNGSVSIISGSTHGVLKHITTDIVSKPSSIAISPDDETLYVASITENKINVISTRFQTVDFTIQGIDAPISMVATEDFLYVCSQTGVNVFGNSGTLSLISTRGYDVTKKQTINLSVRPKEIHMTPDMQTYFIMSENENKIISYRSDINLPKADLNFDHLPTGMITTQTGSALYVCNDNLTSEGIVSIVDLSTNKVTKTIGGMGKSPSGIAISLSVAPVKIQGYVINPGSFTISILENN